MADRGDGVLLAVSGGADSVCLLFLLHELRDELGIRLAAFHLNHGLRGAEADGDEAYVRELCASLSVPFESAHEDVEAFAKREGLSEEEAGRTLRYRHLEETARHFSCEKIATAHHRDDNAETVLMNLFRGSGLKGLGGIPPVRGKLIRPLLCLSRGEIEAWLREKGIAWREDATNSGDLYMRNRIRNGLMPWIRTEINGRAAEHILNTAALAAEADSYLREQALGLLDGDNGIAVSVFDNQPDIIRRYLVREMIGRAAGSRKDISERHVRAVMDLSGPGNGAEADLPYGLRAVRGYERLSVAKAEAPKAGFSVPPCKMRTFPWENGLEIPKKQYTKWFDYGKINSEPVFRSRKEGDYFCLPGGKRKSLRRYFIDEKIPEKERDGVLLLADGDHIIWIVGHRISEYYKVTADTQTVIEITVYEGEDYG